MLLLQLSIKITCCWLLSSLLCARLGHDLWGLKEAALRRLPALKKLKTSIYIGRTDAEAEVPILWPLDAKSWLLGKDPDDGKDWRQEEKGTTRGWDGWIASPTWWTWVWENSRRRWRTGKPGVLQFMGLQRVRHDWETERQQQQIQLQNEY